MAEIIVLDDETEICEEIAFYLAHQGHQLRQASSIASFSTQFNLLRPDIAVVDRMLPDGDGLDLVRRLRDTGHRCGVVVFTAKDASQDRIAGYRSGADHYLTKPIRLQELGAVVKALAWRLQVVAEWLLNSSTFILKTPAKDRIKLTAAETAFLVRLVEAQGKHVSRNEMVLALDKNPAVYESRNLDVLLQRLKKKVAEASPIPLPMQTIHGVGYCMPHGMALSDT
jgi:DNA-binding response OmpR family regulator